MILPRRILQVVTIMNLGGLENFLMNIYRNIDRSKIQFDFLVHRKEEGFFNQEIIKMGGRIFHMPALHPLTLYAHHKKLRTFFAEHPEYKIVHSHINEGTAFVLFAAKKAGVPHRIAHSHIDTTLGKFGKLRDLPKPFVSTFSTQNFACSQKAGKWLFGTKAFTILNNGISVERYQLNPKQRKTIRQKYNLGDLDCLIGHVGRFDTQKNHKFLLEVFSEFHKKYPGAKLLLVGNGSLESEIKEQVQKLNLDASVIYTGAVGNPQDYLSAMDLFLFPSLFEGLPLTLVEAQCNGLPVLMSDTISGESILTDIVRTKSLFDSAEEWAADLQKFSRKPSMFPCAAVTL